MATASRDGLSGSVGEHDYAHFMTPVVRRQWLRRTRTPEGADVPPPEKEVDARAEVRRDSEYLLDQARWLYDLHSARSDSAQRRATAVMAFAGGLLALAPRALDSGPSGLQLVALGATLVFSSMSVVFAMLSLRPRPTKGPSVAELRNLWSNHRKPSGPVDHVHQVAEDLMLSSKPGEDSPLDAAMKDANARIKHLKWAYYVLSMALVAAATLTTATALHY